MELRDDDGPDGSSLKPVSSLRARFENMSKTNEVTVSGSGPGPGPSTSPSPPTVPRQPGNSSPTPKPPPIPETRPSRNPGATVVHDDRNDDRRAASRECLGSSQMQLTSFGGDSGSSSRLTSPRTPLSASHSPLVTKASKAPTVLIEPPQSSPKARDVKTLPDMEANTPFAQDTLKPSDGPLATSLSSSSSRALKSYNGTHLLTTSLDPGRPTRSPLANGPPSPPPPRRSGELRRERQAQAIPPPVNRAEKPSNKRQSHQGDNAQPTDAAGRVLERSPFSSCSRSPSDLEEEDLPPELPVRPVRPGGPPRPSGLGIVKTNTRPPLLEPPPVHPAVASRRRDNEPDGHGKVLPTSPTGTEPPLPGLHSRLQTVHEPQPPRVPGTLLMKPPPRPPRAGIAVGLTATENGGGVHGKRVASTPSATNFAPPPTRGHGRSMTLDRTSDRTPAEFREGPRRVATVADKHNYRQSHPAAAPVTAPATPEITSAYPDTFKTNRRPPYVKKGVHEIAAKYDARIFDVCGQHVCTGGQLTRVWSLLDGELVLSFAHGEGIKSTAVAFKCGLHADDESSRMWIGTNTGELMEADVATQSLVGPKSNAHGRSEVVKIYRHFNEMWSLDDTGTLHVWGPDAEGAPKLQNMPHQTYRLPKGHSFSIIVGNELWIASGKDIRVFAPTMDASTQVQVLVRPLTAEGAAEVTSGALVKTQPGKVFLGHVDGKVSIWSQHDFACLGVLSVSNYKINSLAGVGSTIWAGFNMGRICVYDVEQTPWLVKKDWQAHETNNPVVRIMVDAASFYALDRMQVISLGADNMLKAWDGMMQDDYVEEEMRALEPQYCHFEDVEALFLTWNAGAATPGSLRHSERDATFIPDLLSSSGCPDILVFGFQELVDLEDKTATAKRLFKSKKKKKDAVTDQERMSHQYRDWRDFLVRSLDDYMPSDCLYHLLHTSTLVGLFTCIFVKSSLRDRVRNVGSADIKRGMGGYHGNKGAIIVRFMVDDTSVCFINCHLAAGQSQANARHADIAAILESYALPVERDPSVRIDSYVGGGDGTMALDHEICVLNGDLNYRIDTMSRDTVVNAVKANNLGKLLDRDQLLVARRRNPTFKLRAFQEMPITFAPTYKYDVGTDNYDTSEKKRSPAWCDRLLYRGNGKTQQLDYKRHEVRVSDHRPVTGRFKFTIKTISPKQRALAWTECQQRLEALLASKAEEENLHYLMNVLGYDAATSKSILAEKARRNGRSS